MEGPDGKAGDDAVVSPEKMSGFANRLGCLGLWWLLIGFPIMYCLLFIASDFGHTFGWPSSNSFDIYIDGQPLDIQEQAAGAHYNSWQSFLAVSFTLLVRLYPMWIAFVVAGVLLLLVTVVARQTEKNFLFKPASSLRHLTVELVKVLLVAYFLGCIVHIISYPVFQALDHSGLSMPFKPEYWWPYYGWPVPDSSLQGWTIYPPLGIMPMLPGAEAACVKLGALLAVLSARQMWLRRQRTLRMRHPLKQQ
ncbi:hypothetical protein [Hymenobacter sublimis]|uniref:Uncharacterized protein n=1 Tax=Hymenobacter sublimis TaxID=2933777 RepID=A0ABY4JAY5_9BACT|nr:hypothetical protein [Hymenobacter sublimis]UPL49770.1 hypothetical protein MWH26_02385 [Hymenobacter sublimis]